MAAGSGAEHEPEPRPKRGALRPEIGREYDVAKSVGLSVKAFWRLTETEQEIHRQRFDAEQGKCPHCGNQREDCSDPDKVWYPQLTVCYATRERIAAQARFDRLHQKLPYHDGTWHGWTKDPTEDTPYSYAAGSTVWVAQVDLQQGGDFLRQHDDDAE